MAIAARTGEPPSVLREKWTERDLRELAIYFAHEPSLEGRIDFWGSHLVASAINPWRKKGSPAVKASELIPNWWEKPKERSNGEWSALLQNMAVMLSGK